MPADPQEAMNFCHNVLTGHMAEARAAGGPAEEHTASEYWPFPVYADLMFSV